MYTPTSIGFPRMRKEKGERRAFLPEFVQRLAEWRLAVWLEEGYGESGGYTLADYRQGRPSINACSREQAFQQDLVLVLRAPERQEFDLLRPGACLITMLHYPTRPWRVERLQQLDVGAISLDGIVNDEGVRLVENMKAVAWNGLEVAFDVLEEQLPGLARPDGLPVHVLILGAGLVGKHAVEAGTKLGSRDRYRAYMQQGHPCALVQVVGRSGTAQPELMRRLMQQADVLVDATARRDPSAPVVPNAWLAWLPEHAVIADLAVDPYLLDDDPPVVRGIEGIPQGNLDQYIFRPDDPNWSKSMLSTVPMACRRTVVSCYSWPGIHPDACMALYGRQLAPLLEVLVQKGYDGLSPSGGYFERALTRATLREWLKR